MPQQVTPVLGTPASPLEYWFTSQLLLTSFQLLANGTKRQQVMVQVFGFLLPSWDTQMEFQAAGCCAHLECGGRQCVCLFLLICHTAFQINQQSYQKKKDSEHMESIDIMVSLETIYALSRALIKQQFKLL